MAKIRVLVVDDSVVARAVLRYFLETDSEIEVVGEAQNGKEALQLAIELKPDLVTMDLEMPVMDGLTAITEIMASYAVPILVVSTENDAQKTYAALALGALDAEPKPTADTVNVMEFLYKVKLLSKVRVIKHLRPHPTRSKPRSVSIEPQLPAFSATANKERVFAIASSTGGPQALALILADLPADFPCAILIAQHISDGFAAGMADWLGTLCKLPVHIAKAGEWLAHGVIYISPSESNLTVSPSRRAALIPRLHGEIYRPSCNLLLSSVASVYAQHGIGIILSGMGSDGAQGLLKIRQAGGNTLAQDEASSVIFGMNKVAIDMDAAQQILPASKIAAAMCQLASVSVSERVS